MGLPWYCVHTVVLNDPGRLISIHIMHTALVAGLLLLLITSVGLLVGVPAVSTYWPITSLIWAFLAHLLIFYLLLLS